MTNNSSNSNAPIALNTAALDRLPTHIGRPRYDRQSLRPGIIHIGVGNFHRAHQAWYLHQLMQAGLAQDWAIIGAGVMPADNAMRENLMAQDHLTTLIELDPAGASVEVIGPMIDFLPVEPDNAALIAQMARPETRIVSLTVTEGGYFVDTQTGKIDFGADDLRHDAKNPDQPRTAFGAIVAALGLRRQTETAPFTALCCDNLTGNGDILRQCVVGLAERSDPELAAWIDAEVAFPSSMVDCIVPVTTPEVIAQALAHGIKDLAPVTHENFRQWVIEDKFCNGRPPLEQAGVTLADDMHGYESMKLRILNGGHQLLANVGEICGVETIADCMAHRQISAFFSKVQHTEIVPLVQPVPEVTPGDYLKLIIRRFANPAIRDTTRRVAFDGSSRHVGFLMPVIRDAVAQGTPLSGLALSQALWARMCAGQREDGTMIAANDPNWAALHQRAIAAAQDPRVWLAQKAIYGDLAQNDAFAAEFSSWLSGLWRDGCQETLGRYLER